MPMNKQVLRDPDRLRRLREPILRNPCKVLPVDHSHATRQLNLKLRPSVLHLFKTPANLPLLNQGFADSPEAEIFGADRSELPENYYP